MVIPLAYASIEAAWADSNLLTNWMRHLDRWLARHPDWKPCGQPYLWRSNWRGACTPFVLEGDGREPRFWRPSAYMDVTGEPAA